MKRYYWYLVVFIMCYASFQYGRIHDEGIEYYSPEENTVVYTDRCQIVADTTGVANVIWYRDSPFTLAPEEWYEY